MKSLRDNEWLRNFFINHFLDFSSLWNLFTRTFDINVLNISSTSLFTNFILSRLKMSDLLVTPIFFSLPYFSFEDNVSHLALISFVDVKIFYFYGGDLGNDLGAMRKILTFILNLKKNWRQFLWLKKIVNRNKNHQELNESMTALCIYCWFLPQKHEMSD